MPVREIGDRPHKKSIFKRGLSPIIRPIIPVAPEEFSAAFKQAEKTEITNRRVEQSEG